MNSTARTHRLKKVGAYSIPCSRHVPVPFVLLLAGFVIMVFGCGCAPSHSGDKAEFNSQTWNNNCSNNSTDTSGTFEWCLINGSCDDYACRAHPMCQVCGDGVKFVPDLYAFSYDRLESCDGTDFGGSTCQSTIYGSSGGTLACAADCTLITDNCFQCGNGIIEGTEMCDGTAIPINCNTIWEYDGQAGCTEQCEIDTAQCHIALPIEAAAPWFFQQNSAGQVFYVDYVFHDTPIDGLCGAANCPSVFLRSMNADFSQGWSHKLNQPGEMVYINQVDQASDDSLFLYGSIKRENDFGAHNYALVQHVFTDGTLLWHHEDAFVAEYAFASRGESGRYYLSPKSTELGVAMFKVLASDGTLISEKSLGAGNKIMGIQEVFGSIHVTVAVLDITTYTYTMYRDVYDDEIELVYRTPLHSLPSLPGEPLRSRHGEWVLHAVNATNGDSLCLYTFGAGTTECVAVDSHTTTYQQFTYDPVFGLTYLTSSNHISSFLSESLPIESWDYSSLITSYHLWSVLRHEDRLYIPARRLADQKIVLLVFPTN